MASPKGGRVAARGERARARASGGATSGESEGATATAEPTARHENPMIAHAISYAEDRGVKIQPEGRDFINKWFPNRIDEIPAVHWHVDDTIYLNPKSVYWRDQDVFLNVGDSKWFSSTARDHTIVHEVGHSMHVKSVGKDEFVKIATRKFAPEQHALITREVSGYAATEVREFVAETYAGINAGKKYSKDIMDLYRRFGGPSQ